MSIQDRLMHWADCSGECWVWKGARSNGYGILMTGSRKDGSRRVKGAHVLSYELYKGPIPSGLEIDHLCRNRACINPNHLEAVTHQINTRRSPITISVIRKLRTHCRHGHEFTPENTHIERDGSRSCRRCDNAYSRKSRAPSASAG